MFLREEAETAVNRANAAQKSYEKEIGKFEGVCEKRLALCCEINKNAGPAFSCFINTIESLKGSATNDKTKELIRNINSVASAFQYSMQRFEDTISKVNKQYSEAAGMPLYSIAPLSVLAVAIAVNGIEGVSMAAFGGGALVSSGVGIGSMIAVAGGPVGWGIAAVSLIGGGLFYRSENKETMEKANAAEKKITKATGKLRKCRKEMWEKFLLTTEVLNTYISAINDIIGTLHAEGLNEKTGENCMVILEATRNLSAYLNERIDLKK